MKVGLDRYVGEAVGASCAAAEPHRITAAIRLRATLIVLYTIAISRGANTRTKLLLMLSQAFESAPSFGIRDQRRYDGF